MGDGFGGAHVLGSDEHASSGVVGECRGESIREFDRPSGEGRDDGGDCGAEDHEDECVEAEADGACDDVGVGALECVEAVGSFNRECGDGEWEREDVEGEDARDEDGDEQREDVEDPAEDVDDWESERESEDRDEDGEDGDQQQRSERGKRCLSDVEECGGEGADGVGVAAVGVLDARGACDGESEDSEHEQEGDEQRGADPWGFGELECVEACGVGESFDEHAGIERHHGGEDGFEALSRGDGVFDGLGGEDEFVEGADEDDEERGHGSEEPTGWGEGHRGGFEEGWPEESGGEVFEQDAGFACGARMGGIW